MTDNNTAEITSRQMFFEMADAYQGGNVPPVSKDAWKEIYRVPQCFLINDEWGKDKERADSSPEKVKFFKNARRATFDHLPAEEKIAFLGKFKTAIRQSIFSSRADKNSSSILKNEAAKEFNEMFNTLSAEEKKRMIEGMDSKEALLTRQFGEQYNVPEFRKIDISTLDPQICSDKDLNCAGILQDASYLSLKEMDFLIKGTGHFNKQILEKYINKAQGEVENGGAEKVLTLLQSRENNTLGGAYTEHMPEALFDLATNENTDPKIRSDLLAEGFRIGYSVSGKHGDHPVMQEAQAKNKARVDFDKLSKGEKVPLSGALLKYNEEHLEDILRFGNSGNRKVLLAAVEDNHLSDDSRAKIATTLLKENSDSDSLKLLDTCLDFACSAKRTGTVAFVELETAMKARLATVIQSADERQKEKVKANRKLKDLSRQQDAEHRRTNIEKAVNIVSALQESYKQVTKLDAKADKPYLPKEKAEELISRALKGEKVSVGLIEEPKGMMGLFTGSKEKNRIQEQNEALKEFGNVLGNITPHAQENTASDKREDMLPLFALQSHSGHLLEGETISDLNKQKPQRYPSVHNYDEKKLQDEIERARRDVEFYRDDGEVRGLAEKFKEFRSHLKETARERIKDAKEKIASQKNDPLEAKAKELKGKQGGERTSIANDAMLREQMERAKSKQM